MIRIPHLVLWPLLAAFAVPAQSPPAPNLRPAEVLPGAPVLGPAAEGQRAAALARGSTSTLLVFEDQRAGDSDLFGVRLDPQGVPLDAVPFPVAKAAGNQTSPKVVWNGLSWLVVYANQVDPGSGYFAYQVAALRVSPQGAVLDANPIAIARDDTGLGFAVASDGVGWVVATTGYSAGNSAIRACRIAADGTVLDPLGVEIVPATYFVYFGLGAVAAGSQYLFTWSDQGLRGRRTTTTLQPIDANPVLLSANAPVLTSNGNQYYAVWAFQNAQFQMELRGSRLDTNLVWLDGQGVQLAGPSATETYTNPLATWDGTRWIAAWQVNAGQDWRAARIQPSGSVLDPGGVALPDTAPSYLEGPALGALAGGGAIAAWHDYRYRTTDVFGTTFGASGAAGVERCYGTGSEALQAPRVAAGVDAYLVTFQALSATGSRILAQRVDGFGSALDATPRVVATATHQDLASGGVAWNGTCFLVTWSDGSTGQVLARRMKSDGTFLDANPILVQQGGAPDVAALGDTFLVTALRAPSYPQYVFSYGVRVRGLDGVVLDGTPLPIGPSFATRARVVTLGGKWLVATESHASHNANQSGVVASFVAADGTVAPSFTVGTGNIQDWASIGIAASPTSALVVWQSGSNWTNADVFARRILPDGSMPAAAFVLSGGDPFGQSRADVVWTGEEYVVAWQTFQNNVWSYDYECDLYGVRVSEAGVLTDARGFALWNGPDYERRVAAASLGNGRALFAASTYLDAGHAAFRIATRELRATGTESYGSGTAGCDGAQHLFASGEPRLGASAFALLCDRAPRVASGVVLLAGTPDLAGTFQPALGVRLHLALGGPLVDLAMTSDAAGRGVRTLPIPADPALVGARLHAQCLWRWTGTCVLPPLDLSASAGLSLTLR